MGAAHDLYFITAENFQKARFFSLHGNSTFPQVSQYASLKTNVSGLEKAKRQRFRPGIALVRKERVGIDRKWRPIVLLELQQALQRVLENRVEQPGRGRIGLSQHGHGMNSRVRPS